MIHYVYVLYSSKLDRYYKGMTREVDQRLRRHNSGSEKYTSKGVPWELVCKIEKPDRKSAYALERKLKNLNRKSLLEFIKKYG